jgi:hypothetical protein
VSDDKAEIHARLVAQLRRAYDEADSTPPSPQASRMPRWIMMAVLVFGFVIMQAIPVTIWLVTR